MEHKRPYDNRKVQEDLYQYEMGIDLGAEIEYEKRRHLSEYEKERCSRDYKGVQDRNKITQKGQMHPDQMNRR